MSEAPPDDAPPEDARPEPATRRDAAPQHTSPEPVGLSTSALESWLAGAHPELLTGSPLRAELFSGGRSNLTYRVDGAVHPLVLRRPPLGHVLSTAHDMAREFRVISALAPTAVPVPATYLFHDDAEGAAGVGTPFYLMERVDGRVLSSAADNADVSPEALRALSLELAARLADLHTVDAETVGLGDLGRPDGFLERQVRRWGQQYALSRSRDLPDLDLLQEHLRTSVPATTHSSLIHGDYRLDNAIVRVGAPDAQSSIAAILDWEMATIGDSFTDLGLLDLYWDIRAVVETSDALAAGTVTPSAVEPGAGYPAFAELVDVYARARGISVPDLSWYRAFAAYKLAIILEGIHFRFRAGETVGAGFETVGGMVPLLAADGLRTLGVAGVATSAAATSSHR